MLAAREILKCHRYQFVKPTVRQPTDIEKVSLQVQLLESSGDNRVVLLAEDTSLTSRGQRQRRKNFVVLKCFRRRLSEETAARLFRCVNVNRLANHPCITQFYEIFNRPGYVCVAMEYVPGGNLRDYVRRHFAASGRGLPEEAAGPIFCDVIKGLQHLFRLGAVNRQVMLEHVLLSADFKHAKLCDLLFARMNGREATTKLGNPHYTCPEIWELPEGNDLIRYDGRKADIWSCGVLLYAMLFAKFPFEVHDIADPNMRLRTLGQMITQTEVKFPESAGVSQECIHLIRRMLSKEHNRISIEEIVQLPWYIRSDRFRYLVPTSDSTPTSETIRDIIRRGTLDEASLD